MEGNSSLDIKIEAMAVKAEKPSKLGFLKKLFGGGNQVKSPEEVGLSRSSAAQPEELKDGFKPESTPLPSNPSPASLPKAS